MSSKLNISLLHTFNSSFVAHSCWGEIFIKRIISIVVCLGILKAGFAQNISFTFSSTSGNFCAPATVRFSPDFSSTPISYYWQLGIDNEESEVLNPLFTYHTPGIYRVTLVALFENKILEVSQTVNVFGPANFSLSANKTEFCKPESVTFSVTSSLPLSGLQWDFGDGSPAVSDNSTNLTHTYSGFGNFATTVTAKDSRGCSGLSELPVSIRRPQITLSDSPRIGCLPVTVQFGANVSVLPGDVVDEYRWNFGDGSPVLTTTSGTAQHLYSQPNTYLPKVSIVTRAGCSNNADFSSLSFGNQPGKAKIISPADTICTSVLPIFRTTNTSTASGYLWQLSNGDEINTIDSSLTYQFTDFGLFQVKVTPIFNGCLGEPDSVNIFVQGVIADYRFSNSCSNKSLFEFRNTSRGIVNSYFWSFGDGTSSTMSRPRKQYPNEGSFPLLLRVRQNSTGCEDTITGIIYTAQPRLAAADTFICRGSNLNLTILDNYKNPRVLMNWSLAGRNINNSLENSITVQATTIGVFNNRVIINNGTGYCRDTLEQINTLRVSGPVSTFTIPTNTCISEALPLTNLSSAGSPIDFLVRWSWDFGNGDTSRRQFPPPVDYFAVGNYRIGLVVEDNKGCLDSSSQMARIRRLPILRVFPLNQKICLGDEVRLTALHRSMLQWTPANLVGCDTCTEVVVRPDTPTVYTVVASDNYGCTRTQQINIDIWYPFELEPNVLRDTSICIGTSVPFDLRATGKLVSWTPAAGLNNATIPNPIATPLSSTTYVATVTDSGQCFVRTASATIRVNPFPQVDMGPDLILPYDAPFTLAPIYGPDINAYRWLPANRLNCSTCPTPSGKAEVSTTFTLIATTSQGCTQSFRINLTIDCNEHNLLMPSGFTPNSDGLNDVFYPLTRGMRIINRFLIYNRYGQLVYERKNFPPNDKNYGWDGKFGGNPQPVGSYVYIVEAECDLGQTLNAKGTISILR